MRNIHYPLQGGGDAAGSLGRAAGCAVEVITSSWRRLFILFTGPGQEHIYVRGLEDRGRHILKLGK